MENIERGTDLYKLANEVHDFVMSGAIAETPMNMEDPAKREAWQTTRIDAVFALIFGGAGAHGILPHRLYDKIYTYNESERKAMLDLMQAWNHEHETDPDITYVLNLERS